MIFDITYLLIGLCAGLILGTVASWLYHILAGIASWMLHR